MSCSQHREQRGLHYIAVLFKYSFLLSFCGFIKTEKFRSFVNGRKISYNFQKKTEQNWKRSGDLKFSVWLVTHSLGKTDFFLFLIGFSTTAKNLKDSILFLIGFRFGLLVKYYLRMKD